MGHHRLEGAPLFGEIDLRIDAGQWTCLLGRSGVGKTTLLRLIAGLTCEGEFQGTIRTNDGRDIQGRAAFMAQSDLLMPWLSVLDNTLLGARLRGERPDADRARDLLGKIGLGDHLGKRPAALSGGMRQRVALARTLMEGRPFVFLDEPFSALDAGTRAEMQELAAEMLRGKTVLLVTHDPSEAIRLGHRIIVITNKGTQDWPLPDMAPLRDLAAADVVASQAALLDFLRSRP
ncbi:ABC transporter ATP-binding protein [Primorskyibacter sp. S187A]|uniref:ABC transporter ATP-binding protein n=1 Tax=Primorskyibacter sp. S187A TaxID=3415130 RepID=UPI003C7B5A42